MRLGGCQSDMSAPVCVTKVGGMIFLFLGKTLLVTDSFFAGTGKEMTMNPRRHLDGAGFSPRPEGLEGCELRKL